MKWGGVTCIRLSNAKSAGQRLAFYISYIVCLFVYNSLLLLVPLSQHTCLV